MDTWYRAYRLLDVRGEVGGMDRMKEGEENSQRTYVHSPGTQTTMWCVSEGGEDEVLVGHYINMID